MDEYSDAPLIIYPKNDAWLFVVAWALLIWPVPIGRLVDVPMMTGVAVLLAVSIWHRRIVLQGDRLHAPAGLWRRTVDVHSISRIMHDPSRIGSRFVSDYLTSGSDIGSSLASKPTVSLMVKGQSPIRLSSISYGSDLNMLIECLLERNDQIQVQAYP